MIGLDFAIWYLVSFLVLIQSRMKIWRQAFAAVCSVVVESLFLVALVVGFL